MIGGVECIATKTTIPQNGFMKLYVSDCIVIHKSWAFDQLIIRV